MSQPTGLIAKITLSEENYKKYVQKIAGDIVAQEIFECLINQYNDYYVFQYIKKEKAFYAFFYFNYRNAASLTDHPLLQVLKDINFYLDAGSNGYLIANTNSADFDARDFAWAAKIDNKTLKEAEFSAKELENCRQDAQKYFYPHTQTGFNLALHSNKIVDKNIVARVAKLQENFRIQNVKANLHTATVDQPVELFKGYFYNGRVFYTFSNTELVILEDVDLQNLHQTPYGLCDAKGVIIDAKYLETDPAKFKKHQKGESLYYTSADTVYNQYLEPYSDSDSRSFKILSSCIAEDSRYLYFIGIQIAKEEIGNYQINESGYFNDNIVLYSEKQIRIGKKIITEIDPASFEIISEDVQTFLASHKLENPSGVYGGCFVLHCRDKSGELILHNYDIYKTSVQIERIDSLDEYLKNAAVILKEHKGSAHTFPHYQTGADENYHLTMGEWLTYSFEKKYANNLYNRSFYVALDHYFACCLRLHQNTNNLSFLHSAVLAFEKTEESCFVYPAIFHRMACVYSALDQTKKAVDMVTAAFYCGYNQIEMIWSDVHLKELQTNSDFVALKKYYDQMKTSYPFVNQYILDKIALIPEESYYKAEIAELLLRDFTFPDVNNYKLQNSNYENDDFYQKIKHFVNWTLQRPSYFYDVHYNRFKDTVLVDFETHLYALSYYFFKEHILSAKKDISLCYPIVEKIKSYLVNEETGKLTHVKNNPLNQIFLMV
jgi:hypothetical protein